MGVLLTARDDHRDDKYYGSVVLEWLVFIGSFIGGKCAAKGDCIETLMSIDKDW